MSQAQLQIIIDTLEKVGRDLTWQTVSTILIGGVLLLHLLWHFFKKDDNWELMNKR